jgi:heat shock protein HtpX
MNTLKVAFLMFLLTALFLFVGDLFGGARGMLLALAAVIVMPLVALLFRMAISRFTEYRDDITGAQLAGNPLGLATVLQKLDAYAHRIPMQGSEVASHLFIVNLFTAKNLMTMFSTYPPIGERVKRLKEMRFTS